MPFKRALLGPGSQLRLDELRACQALEVECSRCRHRAMVGLHRLHDRFPGDMKIQIIADHMRCTRCQALHTMAWWVVTFSPRA